MNPKPIINVAAMTQQETKEYVTEGIRSRVDRHLLQTPSTQEARHNFELYVRNVLKELEMVGDIRPPLTESDFKGIVDIMGLEWSHMSTEAPAVRFICERLSDQAIKAMTTPYEEFSECSGVSKFFFLEKLKREGKIIDWSFSWINHATRTGDLSITPKTPIEFVSTDVKVPVD